MSKTVDDWIVESPEPQRTQLQALRAIVLSVTPDATETLKWGQPCYARHALFCYLQRARNHVTLGFQKGALMSDPERRLSGDGKQMRHIKFLPGDPIDPQLCSSLIIEALRLD